MDRGALRSMRSYWDGRARENAAWYVDTTLSFDDPDMEQFWAQGERNVVAGVDEGPLLPERRELAIEIGSGLGRNCLALAKRFDHVIGLDIAPEMVRRARELVTNPAISFEVADGTSMSALADGAADLVFSFTVFQHIPDVTVIEHYIAEAGRVLRPGGVLSFQWNNEPGHRRWVARRVMLSWLQRSGLRPEHRKRHAPEFLGSRVPLNRIERALDLAGLDLVGTRGAGTLFAWACARRR